MKPEIEFFSLVIRTYLLMVEGGQEGVKAVLQRGILLKIIQVSSALAISFAEKLGSKVSRLLRKGT